MNRSAQFVLALALLTTHAAFAETEQTTASELRAESRRLLQESESAPNNALPAPLGAAPQSATSRPVWQEVSPSPPSGLPPTSDVAPDVPPDDLAHNPACPSPQGSPRWEIDLAYIPTTIYNSDRPDLGDAFRIDLAHEEADGYGRRGRFWFFHQDITPWWDLTATTLSYDLYRRVQFERGEIKYGWGPMALYQTDGSDSHFGAVGASIFAEGFYPLLRHNQTDFGPVGSARLAALIGIGDDDGSVEFGTNTIPIIDEFSWGLELRHRFGQHQDKYFFIDITRDLMDWGSPEIPYVAGTSFQGTAVKLGWIW